jgi:hypothetical protein
LLGAKDVQLWTGASGNQLEDTMCGAVFQFDDGNRVEKPLKTPLTRAQLLEIAKYLGIPEGERVDVIGKTKSIYIYSGKRGLGSDR